MYSMNVRPMKVDFMSHFANWVKVTREMRGFSQRELSRRAEISQVMVSRIEGGTVGASPDMAEKLAVALEVSKRSALEAWLVDKVDEDQSPPLELTREPEFPGVRIRVPPGYEHLDDPIARVAEEAASDAYKSVVDILRKHGSRFSVGSVPDESEGDKD